MSSGAVISIPEVDGSVVVYGGSTVVDDANVVVADGSVAVDDDCVVVDYGRVAVDVVDTFKVYCDVGRVELIGPYPDKFSVVVFW